MPEVAQFARSLERTVHVPINESETLAIRWSPQNVSETFWDRRMAEAKAAEEAKARGETIARNPFDIAREVVLPLMTWWDLTANGEPYPITVENIVGFGLPFVLAVSDAIQQDFQIGERAKKASAGDSSTRA